MMTRKCGMQVRGSGVRGQSTLEYLLVGVAVLLAVLYGVKTLIQPGVEARMSDADKTITKAGTELKAAVGF